MRKQVGDGLDAHHMPARSTTDLSSSDGPAIQMEPKDHRETSSFGGGKNAEKYRNELQDKFNNGNARSAMAQEIYDVRRAAKEVSGDARKYNQAMRQMLEYAKKIMKEELVKRNKEPMR